MALIWSAPATDWTQTQITWVLSLWGWEERRGERWEERLQDCGVLTAISWHERQAGRWWPASRSSTTETDWLTITGHNSLAVRPASGLHLPSPGRARPGQRQVWNVIFCLENLFGCCWYSVRPDRLCVPPTTNCCWQAMMDLLLRFCWRADTEHWLGL